MKLLIITILTALRVAFIGDPQVDNMTELGYARQSIFAELLERKDLDLVVIMGDLVNEKVELLPICSDILDSLHCPWVRVHGNHDGRKNIPEDSSFIKDGIRFVLLNREDSPIPAPKAGEKTVYCSHYPFEAVPDSSAACLYISAHLHYIFREMKGNAEHLGVGASCGTWWRGEKDESGTPYALMNCGAQRGYFVAEFRANAKQWYTLRYKAVNKDKKLQADAHLTRDGENGPRILVNVYGGAPFGTLEMKRNGRWVKAEHLSEIDPKVQKIILKNNGCDRAYRKAHRELFIPMLRRASPHIWAIDASGMEDQKHITIRYRDEAMRIRRLKLPVED